MFAIAARTAARLHGRTAQTIGAGIAATILMLTSAAIGEEVTARPQARTSFPGPSTTGVPLDWKPATTYTRTVRISKRGAVLEDVRLVNADLIIGADDVTVRRVEIQGGHIVNETSGKCHNGLLLEDVSLVRAPGQTTTDADAPAVATGGYIARRVKIDGLPEGFRVGGRSRGCAAVRIEDSYVKVTSPEMCRDWHGDGIQGYDGAALTVRNVTLHMVEIDTCGGTAPFFYPHSQGNESVEIDGLLVQGGGAPFRLGTPGSVLGLRIVQGSWGYRPIDVKCSAIKEWDAQIVTIDASGQQATIVRTQPCNTDGGS
ncbi:hypothetical protein [Bradyrhizobium japonicum]|uniref:hypothetical protein n=1 Tax=Bradyrhizobium japonicum TaxID=375 RepID=UPI0006932949|nr:hypothetical protein [Bradyrhizobium japonicum]